MASIRIRAAIDRALIWKRGARHAAAVIMAHNHPSGAPEPILKDYQPIERLRDALAPLFQPGRIRLLPICW
ncbi:JAB domain-containing protein [Pseudomonas oryzihabitans]|uniref:JAB domain-containing protein n=1 Tax=Pseudomonas oryzihabitans TaxID=47885 RepID=UPI00286A7704|nr:JAB domain-containing protein [Pseudomonas psychrotolerans]